MMTEASAATNSKMMEEGRAISSMMKVRVATESTLSKTVRLLNYVLYVGAPTLLRKMLCRQSHRKDKRHCVNNN